MKMTPLMSVALMGATLPAAMAQDDPFGALVNGETFEGAVYAMSNDFSENSVVAYGRRDDGTLGFLGAYPTGGTGAAFDGGEGLDPLISAYAVLLSDDRRHLFAVNAGSNSVSVFTVDEDLGLTLTDTADVSGVGPNSVAYRNGVLYVASIDDDGEFGPGNAPSGVLDGFRLEGHGTLSPIDGATRDLGVRPGSVRFSPNGRFLVVSGLNAGDPNLVSGSDAEIAVYGVSRSGMVSGEPLSTGGAFTEGRPLPNAIGVEVVADGARQFIVAAEAREQLPTGEELTPFTLPAGSVSSWELLADGSITPVDLDVETGFGTLGERTSCWVQFSPDGTLMWSANTADSSLGAYAFDEGRLRLIDPEVAEGEAVDGRLEDRRRRDADLRAGRPDPFNVDAPFEGADGFIDFWLSDDGEYLYQLVGLQGEINVYKVEPSGDLGLIQVVTGDLPQTNTQGIVAF